MLAPTGETCAVVCYFEEDLLDAAQFPDREPAIAWAKDLRRMLVAQART